MSDIAYNHRDSPGQPLEALEGAQGPVASVEPRRDGFEGRVNRDANHPMWTPRNRDFPEEAGDGRNGDSGQASNRIIEVAEELSTCASQCNTGDLLEVRKDELIGQNSAILAREKLARETDMLLDEQNGNTVEAFTDASTTSVDSSRFPSMRMGGGTFLWWTRCILTAVTKKKRMGSSIWRFWSKSMYPEWKRGEMLKGNPVPTIGAIWAGFARGGYNS